MCEETDVEGAQLEPLQHPLACVHPMGSRCDFFHKVVVNKGVHSMQTAWNKHFLLTAGLGRGSKAATRVVRSNPAAPVQALSPDLEFLEFCSCCSRRVVQWRCHQGSAISHQLSAGATEPLQHPGVLGGNQERHPRVSQQ